MRLSLFVKKSTMFLLFITSSVNAVTITVDGTDGAVAVDGVCSISEAIQAANTNSMVNECDASGSTGSDTIELTTDITLTARFNGNEGGNGTPYITGAILLDGNGFSISRSNAATDEFRILFVAATGDLDLRNITLSNGLVTGYDGGGAIENIGTISRIQNSTFSGNHARYGGAIENYNANYTANTGIILNSTFSGNSATLHGGGLYSNSAITTIQNSTFSGNSAENGGGLYIFAGAINTIQNSTFSGNSAEINGKAILLDEAEILNFNNILFHKNINQTSVNACGYLLNGAIINSANNISDDPNDNCPNTNTTLNTLSVADLADNGGPTMTHALLPGSEAIDAGDGNSTTTDQRGFTATNTRDIGAFETFVPLVMAPTDVLVEATGPLTSPALGVAIVTDTDNPGLMAAPSQNTNFALGTTSILWTATDSYGFIGTDTQDVTIVDTTSPTISVPAGITMEATGALTTVALGAATATDLVDTNPAISSDAPASFPVGVTTVTWTATDASNNSASATQAITIVDTNAPTVIAPADITMEATGTLTTVVLGNATATDTVDGTLPVTSDAPVSFPVGVTTVTYSATDSEGLTAVDTQLVTIEDTTAPVISITGDNPLNLIVGDTFVDQGATAADTVDGTIVTTTSGAVDTSIAGTYNITYQATDNQGNTASAIRVVIVNPVAGSPTPVPAGNLWTWLVLVSLMLVSLKLGHPWLLTRK